MYPWKNIILTIFFFLQPLRAEKLWSHNLVGGIVKSFVMVMALNYLIFQVIGQKSSNLLRN